MTFLAMIFALVLERLSPVEDWLHRDGWFLWWQRRVAALGVTGFWHALVVVLLPCVLAQVVLNHLQPLLFGLVWMVAAVVLLLYALGRGSQSAEQERYRSQCRREDFESALIDVESRFGWFGEEKDGLDSQRIHKGIQQGFLYRGYERWFGVLFYFLLLGPAGALGYRLLQLTCTENDGERPVLMYIDWLPARLLATTFALAGNFVASADDLLRTWKVYTMPTGEVLHSVALAATGEQPLINQDGKISGQLAAAQNESFAALMRRASVCWVAIISVLVVLL